MLLICQSNLKQVVKKIDISEQFCNDQKVPYYHVRLCKNTKNIPLITTEPACDLPIPKFASCDHVHGKLEQSAL